MSEKRLIEWVDLAPVCLFFNRHWFECKNDLNLGELDENRRYTCSEENCPVFQRLEKRENSDDL